MNTANCYKRNTREWLGGTGDPLWIVQESKIWPCWQMVYAKTRICPGVWDSWKSLWFWDTKCTSRKNKLYTLMLSFYIKYRYF